MAVMIGPLLECVDHLPHSVMLRCVGSAADENDTLRFPTEKQLPLFTHSDDEALTVTTQDLKYNNYVMFEKLQLPPRVIWRRVPRGNGEHLGARAGLKDPRGEA
jgi:hypothetical protein